MKISNKILIVIITLLFSTDISCQYELNASHKPSSAGIRKYVENNQVDFIGDFQNFICDSISDIYFSVEDISAYSDADSFTLARFYPPNTIVISNRESYWGYEYIPIIKTYMYNGKIVKYNCKKNNGNKRNKTDDISDNISSNEYRYFVRNVVMHELCHYYFYQTAAELHRGKTGVDNNYLQSINFNPSCSYGAEFIEEGLCEYVYYNIDKSTVNNNGKSNVNNDINIDFNMNVFKPLSIQDLENNQYDPRIEYGYSRYYVEKVIELYRDNNNSTCLKHLLPVILRNQPPSTGEILKPESFVKRLVCDK